MALMLGTAGKDAQGGGAVRGDLDGCHMPSEINRNHLVGGDWNIGLVWDNDG